MFCWWPRWSRAMGRKASARRAPPGARAAAIRSAAAPAARVATISAITGRGSAPSSSKTPSSTSRGMGIRCSLCCDQSHEALIGARPQSCGTTA
ncbi:hypothetical protein [Paludisphaera sp.]|uniref:hypothetical protein n=1 Tax=Paludisphaera sp. TaxID=2017432 RepID=UPI00301E02B2